MMMLLMREERSCIPTLQQLSNFVVLDNWRLAPAEYVRANFKSNYRLCPVGKGNFIEILLFALQSAMHSTFTW